MKELKESLPFFKMIWLALNPWRYDELHERTTGNVMKYFFSFVFVVFVLAIVLMLPAIASFANNQMSHFDTLEVKFNTSMNSPVVFPENNPYVTVDTRKSEGTLKEGKYLITDDYIYMKTIFGGVRSEKLGGYKNLLANDWMVLVILLLLMPSVLFLFYIGYVIKLLLVVLLAAILGLVITRIAKFDITFGGAVKTGLMATTPMIIIDLIRLPFALNLYYAQYIAFLIFFIVGIVKIGDFEGSRPHKHKSGKRKGGGYIDLTKKI
ncbi:DUF1189 family protein [Candidatus Woesearchaeota archaeon]|nr:DUF1189 family protein [Candidatus Woesearchaeota archaeon]